MGKTVMRGIIKNIKIHTAANNAEMAFATLVDYNGEIELVFFSKTWARCKNRINTEKPVALIGEIYATRLQGRLSFCVSGIRDIDKLNQKITEKTLSNGLRKILSRRQNRRSIRGKPIKSILKKACKKVK